MSQNDKSRIIIHSPQSLQPQVPISADALRMRVRRLCERKSGGKLNVPQEVHEDFVNGGSAREVLELALLQAIERFGTSRSVYKRVRVTRLQNETQNVIQILVHAH